MRTRIAINLFANCSSYTGLYTVCAPMGDGDGNDTTGSSLGIFGKYADTTSITSHRTSSTTALNITSIEIHHCHPRHVRRLQQCQKQLLESTSHSAVPTRNLVKILQTKKGCRQAIPLAMLPCQEPVLFHFVGEKGSQTVSR